MLSSSSGFGRLLDEEMALVGSVAVDDGISDTTPEAARVQLDLLRSVPPEERIRACLRLSQALIEVSRQGLRERMPGASQTDLDVAWVAQEYGEVLARGVARRIGTQWPRPTSS